ISGHLDVHQLGVEGVPVVEERREEVQGAGLVDALFDALLLEEIPFHGAHADLGGSSGVRVEQEDACEHGEDDDRKYAHDAPYFLTWSSFIVCSRFNGLIPLAPSLGRTRTSIPL